MSEFMYGKVESNGDIVIFDNGEKMELEGMQKIVQGSIEYVYINKNMAGLNIDLFINEEGKYIEGLKPTGVMMSKGDKIIDILMGPILFTCTDDDGDTLPLNTEQITYLKDLSRLCKVRITFKEESEPITLLALKLD